MWPLKDKFAEQTEDADNSDTVELYWNIYYCYGDQATDRKFIILENKSGD